MPAIIIHLLIIFSIETSVITKNESYNPSAKPIPSPMHKATGIDTKHIAVGANIKLFLGGDVMTGRAIDQILPYPGDPRIHERYVTMATYYIEMAEKINGAIPTEAGFDYIWGDALDILKAEKPDLRIINLETAVTTNDNYWKGRGVNYRMNPKNTPVLKAAGIDFCALANNHSMDYGLDGLKETIVSLDAAKINHSGAGKDRTQAAEPAILNIQGKGRAIVFSLGSTSSGIPDIWSASSDRPGLHIIQEYARSYVSSIKSMVRRYKKENDIVILSIHWGPNWGYEINEDQRALAHAMIDEGGVDIIHGHSSHHPKGMEVYHDKLIIYGSGDLINDYEGIKGYAKYRPELNVMYFAEIDPATGTLQDLSMIPIRLMNFQISRADGEETKWLTSTLSRECKRFDADIASDKKDRLTLLWGNSLPVSENKNELSRPDTVSP